MSNSNSHSNFPSAMVEFINSTAKSLSAVGEFGLGKVLDIIAASGRNTGSRTKLAAVETVFLLWNF